MDEKKVMDAIKHFKWMLLDLEGMRFKYVPKYYKTAIEALEKQLQKKPICVPKRYTEELGFNDEFLCPVCKSYVGYFTEGMSEPEQMEYCNNCGQHIAKDWSED